MLEKEEMKVEKGAKQKEKLESKEKLNQKRERAITLIALVITIVLNSSYLAMGQMNKFEKI